MDQSGPKEDWKFHPRITWNWSYFRLGEMQIFSRGQGHYCVMELTNFGRNASQTGRLRRLFDFKQRIKKFAVKLRILWENS